MKTVRKTVCLLGVCAVAAGLASTLSAQTPVADEKVAPGSGKKPPPPPPPEAARVLDLSGRTIPIVIDQPGYYRLDRSWSPDHQGAQGAFLEIRANFVTLDFRGYSIDVSNEGPAILVLGSVVTLRNGSVLGGDDQGLPLSVQGSGVTIEKMNVGGLNASEFGSTTTGGVVVRDSVFFGGLHGLPAGTTLERNVFHCRFTCGFAISDDTRVVDNVWQEHSDDVALVVQGSGNLVERNVFAASDRPSITVDGRANLLRDNTIRVDGFAGPVLRVNSRANVLEANVVLPVPGGEKAAVGIQFTADGNSFGNNRLGALVPVDVGGTRQTDWGGNVGF